MTSPQFQDVAPVLMTGDVPAALERYRLLGFEATPYEDGSRYGYLRRGSVALHVSWEEVDPERTSVSAYLYVDDADAVHAEWSASGADGVHHPPVDTVYGFREGAYVDPDGNELRYGSRLQS